MGSSRAKTFRPLKSFFPTADELLKQDFPTLGRILLAHLKSYEGLNTVYQHAGLHRGYFRAMLENRNVGLGPLPTEPEYGSRQPEVTKRMMEAWNWLERQGMLIHNDQQVADWFTISSDEEDYTGREKPPAPPPSPDPTRVSEAATGTPRALLSYSWDGPEHQQWVAEFAERLQGESGVEIIFDRWHLNPGDDKLHFMEQAVADSNFVILVCAPAYAERANKRQGGVGYESMVITAELAEHILTTKFIPVLRKGTWNSSLPIYLKSKLGVNLGDEPYNEDEYERLLRALHGVQIQPPPLGSKPDFAKKPEAEHQPAGFIAATAEDGSARFRRPGQPLGVFWETQRWAQSPDYEVFLAKGPAIWLRIMPRYITSDDWSHDELLRCGRGGGMPLRPLFWSNLQYLRAEDGVGVYATIDNLRRETETTSVTFAFNTGELWCVDTAVLQLDGQKHLYFLDIARTLVRSFFGYGEFLKCLRIPPPYNWIAGLEGIKGWRLKVPPSTNHISASFGETCLSDVVVASGTFDLKQPSASALRPFFTQLFRKCSTRIPEHIEEAIRNKGNF